MPKKTDDLKPVYEAHFTDGTIARMTFYSARGKAIDIQRGRRLIETAAAERPNSFKYVRAPYYEQPDDASYTALALINIGTRESDRYFPRSPLEGKTIARGFVEWQGHRWQDVGQASVPLPGKASKPARRPNARKVLSELLAYLDGDSDNAEAIERARQLLAA